MSGLLIVGASRAEASTITWHWAGAVTGYDGLNCTAGFDCGPALEAVVPLGTTIDVFVSLDPALPPPNPLTPCYRGTASTSFQVLGQTYTGTGHVWDEAFGFGPGVCMPGYNVIEIVVPGWGSGSPPLPDGWVAFSPSFLPGLWWVGDLTSVQPTFVSSQFPSFFKPGESAPQRFTANLQAVPADLTPVPEPATLTLFGAGLAAAWAARRRRRL